MISFPSCRKVDCQKEFEDFTDESRQLEQELETTLIQNEKQIRDLNGMIINLRDDNESLRVSFESHPSVIIINISQPPAKTHVTRARRRCLRDKTQSTASRKRFTKTLYPRAGAKERRPGKNESSSERERLWIRSNAQSSI